MMASRSLQISQCQLTNALNARQDKSQDIFDSLLGMNQSWGRSMVRPKILSAIFFVMPATMLLTRKSSGRQFMSWFIDRSSAILTMQGFP